MWITERENRAWRLQQRDLESAYRIYAVWETVEIIIANKQSIGDRSKVKTMTNTAAVSKDKLEGIFDTESLTGTTFKVTITPITEDEAKDTEFKSLKGIAGKWLDQDEVRRERLGL